MRSCGPWTAHNESFVKSFIEFCSEKSWKASNQKWHCVRFEKGLGTWIFQRLIPCPMAFQNWFIRLGRMIPFRNIGPPALLHGNNGIPIGLTVCGQTMTFWRRFEKNMPTFGRFFHGSPSRFNGSMRFVILSWRTWVACRPIWISCPTRIFPCSLKKHKPIHSWWKVRMNHARPICLWQREVHRNVSLKTPFGIEWFAKWNRPLKSPNGSFWLRNTFM